MSRCPYCDGTGDVHSITGEWRGVCTECNANVPEIHEVRFRRHDIHVSKDRPDANWYIVVTGPSGLRDYDGWWQDSDSKTWKEALAEAKCGACLTPQPPDHAREEQP